MSVSVIKVVMRLVVRTFATVSHVEETTPTDMSMIRYEKLNVCIVRTEHITSIGFFVVSIIKSRSISVNPPPS
jgi:hypothetical protein